MCIRDRVDTVIAGTPLVTTSRTELLCKVQLKVPGELKVRLPTYTEFESWLTVRLAVIALVKYAVVDAPSAITLFVQLPATLQGPSTALLDQDPSEPATPTTLRMPEPAKKLSDVYFAPLAEEPYVPGVCATPSKYSVCLLYTSDAADE